MITLALAVLACALAALAVLAPRRPATFAVVSPAPPLAAAPLAAAPPVWHAAEPPFRHARRDDPWPFAPAPSAFAGAAVIPPPAPAVELPPAPTRPAAEIDVPAPAVGEAWTWSAPPLSSMLDIPAPPVVEPGHRLPTWPALVDPAAAEADPAARRALADALAALDTPWSLAIRARAEHDEPDPAVRAAFGFEPGLP